jgi:mono/diheme cytochrome c family protein
VGRGGGGRRGGAARRGAAPSARWGRLALAAACAGGLAPALAPAAPAGAFAPAVEYALHCQGCHLADGGATPGSVPALAGSVGRLARTPAGRAYLARVPGVAQAPLADADLAALLNYVVARFGGPESPAGFVPYGAEEVGRLRRAPLVDVESARRAVAP